MSVPLDLAELRSRDAMPPVVISANGHAVKAGLKPDYIVCKDDVHTETGERMEDVLRPLGAPIISYWPWADYLLHDWPYQGNSGLHAILLAVLMGGHPVVPIGFDFYEDGTYWHDPEAPNISRGAKVGLTSRKRIESLKFWSRGAAIRPMSGKLLETFPRFAGLWAVPPRETPPVVRHYLEFQGEDRRARDRRILRGWC